MYMLEPAVIQVELSTGQSVDACITMKGLKSIASVDKALYKTVCGIMNTGTSDVVADMALIYAGYLIANKPTGVPMRQAINSGDLLKQEEFEELLPDNMVSIVRAASNLIDPPTQAASGEPLSAAPDQTGETE